MPIRTTFLFFLILSFIPISAYGENGFPDLSSNKIECDHGLSSEMNRITEIYRKNGLIDLYRTVFNAWGCRLVPNTVTSNTLPDPDPVPGQNTGLPDLDQNEIQCSNGMTTAIYQLHDVARASGSTEAFWKAFKIWGCQLVPQGSAPIPGYVPKNPPPPGRPFCPGPPGSKPFHPRRAPRI